MTRNNCKTWTQCQTHHKDTKMEKNRTKILTMHEHQDNLNIDIKDL